MRAVEPARFWISGSIGSQSRSSLSSNSRRLARENGTLYLVAVNGATLCTPDAATMDCSGVTFGTQRIEVAGLGPGVDFCMRTKRRNVSHVFFTNDIENETSAVALWYVTRKSW